MTDALDNALLAAHAAGDRTALVALYHDAAMTQSCENARGFFLTHAYIFALEADDPRAPDIHARLVALGREA